MTETLLNKIICTKKASRDFALVSAEKRSKCLYTMAELMRENKPVILDANAKEAIVSTLQGKSTLCNELQPINALADIINRFCGNFTHLNFLQAQKIFSGKTVKLDGNSILSNLSHS